MSLILAVFALLTGYGFQTVSLPGPGPIHVSSAPTITYVQGCHNGTGAASVTCAMGSNITAGNLLVITSKTGSTALSSVTFSTSSGVSLTFTQAVAPVFQGNGPGSPGTDNFTTALYAAAVPSTGAETIQAAWSGNIVSGPFTDIGVAEYSTSHTWASTALDQSASNASATSSTSCPTGTTAATANAHDLVVAVCQEWNNGQTWGALSGFVQRPTSSTANIGWYDQSVSATGTQSATIPQSTADYGLGMIAAFKSN